MLQHDRSPGLKQPFRTIHFIPGLVGRPVGLIVHTHSHISVRVNYWSVDVSLSKKCFVADPSYILT